MAALATSVLSSCRDSALSPPRVSLHGRIGAPAYRVQMQVPGTALFKSTVSSLAALGRRVHLNRVNLRSHASTPVRCSSRDDATPAGEDAAEGLSLIEQNLRRRREEKQRRAAEQATLVPANEDKKPDTNPDNNPEPSPTEIVTGLDPTGVTSAAPDADVSKQARVSRQTQERVDRWQKLGIPVSTLFFGPDGERIFPSTDEDKAIFMELDTTGLEQALRWREPQRKVLLDDVIKGSGFSPADKGNIVVTRKTASLLIFGTFEKEPAETLRTVEEKLKLQSPDLTAILVEIRPGAQVAGLSFLPRRSLLTLTLPGPLPYLLSFGSLLFCLFLSSSLSTLAIDLPPLSILSLWQHSITPTALFVTFASSLAAVTTVAARYRILHLLTTPVFLPSATFGSFGVVTSYKGLLPGKAPAFDLALAASLAPLLTSSAITAAGILAGSATRIGGVPADFIFVPETIFAHSGPLTQLASSLASVVILPDATPADISMGVDVALTSAFPFAEVASSVPQLVIDPLVFGGLVALNASLMTLLPIGKLSGGMIVHSLFGPRIARLVSGAFIVGVGLKLVLNNVNDGVWWGMLVLSWVSKDGGGQPLRDSVTSPGVGRTVVGCGLVAAACTILLS